MNKHPHRNFSTRTAMFEKQKRRKNTTVHYAQPSLYLKPVFHLKIPNVYGRCLLAVLGQTGVAANFY